MSMTSERAVASFAGGSLALAALTACWLYPKPGLPHAATSNTVLFDREIVRILNTHCVMCHSQGGTSFSLATYEEAWRARKAIHDSILARHMPPWAAVPGYGAFVNANRLTLREQRFIVSWVEGLGPRNTGTVFLNVLDGGAAPHEELAASIDFDAWALGEPDRVVALDATAFAAGITDRGRVRRAVIDLAAGSETWLGALEYRPAQPHMTRAAVFTVERTGQWLATWTPWHGLRRLTDGSAYRLATNDRIVAEIHTVNAADRLSDAGRLGLHFVPSAGRTPVIDQALVASGEVPAGAARHGLKADRLLAADTRVLALWPSLTEGIESLQVSARRPDGTVEVLLFALEIPPDWPTPYVYATPIALPTGSRLSLTAYVSNAGAVARQTHIELHVSSLEPHAAAP